ncbi:MAG: histidine kinase dimerization/phospho-acceptor domain-containing protein [Bacillota bacterium]
MDTKSRRFEQESEKQSEIASRMIDGEPKHSVPPAPEHGRPETVSEEPVEQSMQSELPSHENGKPRFEAEDPKPRKSRPFAAWICFALGISIIGVCTIAALAGFAYSNGNWESLKALFTDYRNSIPFKEQTSRYFTVLLSSVANPSPDTGTQEQEYWRNLLDSEGENLKYYAVNTDSGLVIANIESKEGGMPFVMGSDGIPILPDGYDYCWYSDGEKVLVIDHGEPVDTERLDSGYRCLIPGAVIDPGNPDNDPYNAGAIKVLLAVNNVLVKNPYNHSPYFQEQQLLHIAGRVYVGMLVFGVVLFTYGMIKRRDKRVFDRKLAAWSGRLWLEAKIFLSSCVFISLINVGCVYWRWTSWEGLFYLTVISGIVILALWWFYVMLVDLIINRRRFFSHNSINLVLTWYRNYERKYPWQKMMLRRAYALVFTEAVMALLSVFLLLTAYSGGRTGFSLMVALLLPGIGIYFIYRYLRRYGQTVGDLGLLMEHIEKVKSGDMETKLHVEPDADTYPAAQNLNFIQEGMSLAVSEKIRSERMKVDLITNVSHDLKTPLTSIVSYVELLSKEENLPEHVNDYVAILAQKTERLKHLIQDLFDLSKATSDNMALDMERIDLARLINQALADMQEPMDDSGLAFRVNVPDEPVHILSDGKKLYRAFQNLISNTLKYSLLGSRVFVDLTVIGNEAVATIKNTANYEMDFDEDEILQRFTRGDRSRSTEGSGLGLSIAQSFTEACGGWFGITIDGDLFKVELRFETD